MHARRNIEVIPHSKNKRPYYDILRSVFSLDTMATEAYEWRKANHMDDIPTQTQNNEININEDDLQDLR
jgi:hypothetical protein